jgi:hypothetical protein
MKPALNLVIGDITLGERCIRVATGITDGKYFITNTRNTDSLAILLYPKWLSFNERCK